VCEFVAPQGLTITEDGDVYAFQLPVVALGQPFKNLLRDRPIGQHLFGILMQGEDAPQRSNAVTLDPTVRDVFGLPAPRITYANHPLELEARRFYLPVLKAVVANAGTTRVFATPCDFQLGGPPTSRHVMGTLRMGMDPAASVTRPDGRFHDVDNLYCCDGSVFPTGGGWNPTLTIIAVALRTARGMAAG
jgi:gluconate 2-dehydrogenase alpha chain